MKKWFITQFQNFREKILVEKSIHLQKKPYDTEGFSMLAYEHFLPNLSGLSIWKP